MTTPDQNKPTSSRGLLSGGKTWWIMPMIVGLVLTAAVLLVTDFYPDLKRFYSVF